MDFNISNLWVLNIGGIDVWITETVINVWIVMLLLIVFSVIVHIKLSKFSDVPTGFQNFIELVVEAFEGFVKNSAGEKLSYLASWFFMVFLFVLISNLSGLVGLRPPTADWTVTGTLAFVTFILIQVLGFKYRKGAYIKGFFEPYFFFLPLNIIGELARPISLSFRLFGCILSGMLLITMFYTLTPIYVRFFIPVALHAFFDVFYAILQAYIFCVLSLTFIGNMAATETE